MTPHMLSRRQKDYFTRSRLTKHSQCEMRICKGAAGAAVISDSSTLDHAKDNNHILDICVNEIYLLIEDTLPYFE